MIETCSYNDCCGCMACIDICPKHAIKYSTNEHGVSVPVIKQEICVDCGLCKKVCPQIQHNMHDKPEACLAAYVKDSEKRADSASGGIGRAIYEYFLTNKEAVVFGVELVDGVTPVYSHTCNINEIAKYQGSKYVQPNSCGLYANLAAVLQAGKRALLISSPCVITAAYNYLQAKKISTELFYTVDLLCHGVSPETYLHEEIEYLSNKYGWQSINSITFRSNRKFKNFHFVVAAITKKGKKVEYNRYSNEDPYFSSFLDGTTLREGCYHCKFSRPERVADLTIGDFIGLGESDKYPKVSFPTFNNSLVIVHTSKGHELLAGIQPNITCVSRSFEEALVKGTSLHEPFKKSMTRELFLKKYPADGFIKSILASNGNIIKIGSRKSRLKRPIIQILIQLSSKS